MSAVGGSDRQLLHDAELLELAFVRHPGGGDVDLSRVWGGRDLDAEGAVPGEGEHPWPDLGPGLDQDIYCPGLACGTHDNPVLAASGCTRDPSEEPGPTGVPVMKLSRAAGLVERAETVAFTPQLVARAEVNSEDVAVFGSGISFEWQYRRDEEDGTTGGKFPGIFRMGSVDDYLWNLRTYRSQDAILYEYVRRLVGGVEAGADATLPWGEGQRLRHVLLGNELERPGSELNARELAWYVLRTCQFLHQCAPTVLRIFPGMKHPRRTFESSETPCHEYFSDVPSLERRATCALDATFFHIVRAALVVQVMEDAPDQFTGVLGEGIGGDAWEDLREYLEEQGYAAEEIPNSPLSLDYGIHREQVRHWALWRRKLVAPFHAVDFHWYGAKAFWPPGDVPEPVEPCDDPDDAPVEPETAGTFAYLSEAAKVVEQIRDRIDHWWANSESVGVWCTETGVASHQAKYHIDETARHRLPDPEADAVVANPAYYEVRVNPGKLDGCEFDDERTLAGHFKENPTDWPTWAFTSEREQARQVWHRLSFLYGQGVDEVAWFTNMAEVLSDDPSGDDGNAFQQFYSYGVTTDLQMEDEPKYRYRRKKPAFCALRRWNQYLGRFVRAKVLPGLDGTHGYYAVVFERSPEDVRGKDYPYAVVAWADPQAYTSVKDGEEGGAYDGDMSGRPPLTLPEGLRIGHVNATPPWLHAQVHPIEVDTVPDEEVVPGLAEIAVGRDSLVELFTDMLDACPGDEDGGFECGVDNPCVDDSDRIDLSSDPQSYRSSNGVWVFGADKALDRESMALPDGSTGTLTYFQLDSDVKVWFVLMPRGALKYEAPYVVDSWPMRTEYRWFDLCEWSEVDADDVDAIQDAVEGGEC